MRAHKLDDRRVICPNAELLCGGTRALKRGMFFTYNSNGGQHMARSLGHVTAPPDGPDVPAFDGIFAMVLSADASFVFIRWVEAFEVTRIQPEPPHRVAAFFFKPTLPYPAETMVRLIDYGTCCERFIDAAPMRAAEFERVP
jgi:hypothetical protein